MRSRVQLSAIKRVNFLSPQTETLEEREQDKPQKMSERSIVWLCMLQQSFSNSGLQRVKILTCLKSNRTLLLSYKGINTINTNFHFTHFQQFVTQLILVILRLSIIKSKNTQLIQYGKISVDLSFMFHVVHDAYHFHQSVLIKKVTGFTILNYMLALKFLIALHLPEECVLYRLTGCLKICLNRYQQKNGCKKISVCMHFTSIHNVFMLYLLYILVYIVMLLFRTWCDHSTLCHHQEDTEHPVISVYS